MTALAVLFHDHILYFGKFITSTPTQDGPVGHAILHKRPDIVAGKARLPSKIREQDPTG